MNRIDNHFSEKLKDLEIKPSERANRLFMEQIAPQKKPVWKYFTMAASVLLAMGVLLGLYLNSGVLTPETANSLPKIKEESKENSSSENNVNSTSDTINEAEISNRIEEIKTEKKFAYQNTTGFEPKNTNENKLSFTYEEREDYEPVRVSNLKRVSGFKYYDTELTDFSILDVHSSEIEIEKPAVRIISSPAEKTLIAKVADEILYIVHGEQPDLDRSGIKPTATVIAHNQNGFIANETRQIKQGLNKVKEIFK